MSISLYQATISEDESLGYSLGGFHNHIQAVLTETSGTDAIKVRGNEVNGFYLGIYAMLAILANIGLVAGAGQFVLQVVPGSSSVLHERLLKTVMDAPLSFFTSTDTGITTNR